MTPERFPALIRGDARGPGAVLARAGLWWARLPYGAATWTRNRLFDLGLRKPTRVPVPVVSVGNLTLGGTGKTPCVESVAGFYRGLGLAVAVLSRGYGADAGRNDEAMVLEENLPDVPHLQGADRVGLAATAVEELESDVLVLDDGFQHRRLARDLDIVLLDATQPLRREYLFPRGLLREPVGSLSRAGLVVLTRADQVEPEGLDAQRHWLRARFPALPVATAVHAPVALVGTDDTRDVLELKGKPVGAFCGIGNPEAFRRTLADLGAKVVAFRAFPDHHPYSRADVDEVRTWAAALPPGAAVATTQKDLVKLRLPDLADRPLWAVRVGMRFTGGEDVLREKLRAAVGGMTNDPPMTHQ
jgi:tetraacyldisaccharide 4'-kinase